MPDAKDNAKQAGDTRQPEVASDKSSELGDEGRPGRGINQAGFIKDREAPTDDA